VPFCVQTALLLKIQAYVRLENEHVPRSVTLFSSQYVTAGSGTTLYSFLHPEARLDTNSSVTIFKVMPVALRVMILLIWIFGCLMKGF
jgi:hypothetical protein